MRGISPPDFALYSKPCRAYSAYGLRKASLSVTQFRLLVRSMLGLVFYIVVNVFFFSSDVVWPFLAVCKIGGQYPYRFDPLNKYVQGTVISINR
jgi:hypothetical protein